MDIYPSYGDIRKAAENVGITTLDVSDDDKEMIFCRVEYDLSEKGLNLREGWKDFCRRIWPHWAKHHRRYRNYERKNKMS